MKKHLIALFAFAFSGACFAQANVEALTQQGGKKMSKEDLQKLHEGGLRYTGLTPGGLQFSQQHKPDGSLSGSITNSRGTASLEGKWTVDDEGRLCVDAVVPSLKANVKNCVHIWKQDEKYFSSVDASPGALVAPKQFAK